ncbi:hypothetical protein FAGAP_649 [Fusarium agapanthi]|uniref:Uncharacterized protein n=1 Tax=Fusarium agapanthi TaxID=1803897 RepID=A0A9P5BKN3_9HYPO|nr:hypothetical protein FAGAP_649 [Fusarium agapanthi]
MEYSSILSKPKSFFGKQKVWMARGEDLALFNMYRANIQNLLRHSYIPESNHNLWIGLYRIGTTEDEAKTFVVVSCSDRRIRKLTRDILSSCPIFQPGQALNRFKVVSKATLPETACEPQQTMKDGAEIPSELSLLGKSDDTAMENPKTTIHIYPSNTGDNYLCRQVQAFQGSEGGGLESRYQTATAGPLLWHNGVTYQLTVAHVVEFKNKQTDDGTESTEDGVDDWDEEDDEGNDKASNNESTDDGISDSLSSDSSREYTIEQGGGSVAARRKETTVNKEPAGIPASLHSPAAMALPREPNLGNFILEDYSLSWNRHSLISCPISSEMDYLLIPITVDPQTQASMGAEIVQISEAFDVTEQTDPRPVIIAAPARGYVEGFVFPAASLLRPQGSKDFQPLFCIESGETLPQGSSGSAVFDKMTGFLAGHIILGCPDKNIWYMVPIVNVLDDLEHHFCLKAKCQIRIYATAAERWVSAFKIMTIRQSRLPESSEGLLDSALTPESEGNYQTMFSGLRRETKWGAVSIPIPSFLKVFLSESPVRSDHWRNQFGHNDNSAESDRRLLASFRDLRYTFLEPMARILPGGAHEERRAMAGKYRRDIQQPQAWMLEIFEPFIRGTVTLNRPRLLELLERKGLLHESIDSPTYAPQCLYIKNIDPSTAVALYKTTSWRPMKECRELFSTNASYQPNPVIDIIQDDWHGSACFSITINLPFLVITTQNEIFKRSRAGGSGFRTLFGLDFLQIPAQSCVPHDKDEIFQAEESYLFLATWSTILIGTNERYWTAVCLDDGFGERITVDDASEDKGISPSSSEGQTVNVKKTMPPRSYALRVLAIQLDKVARYHQKIILALEFNLNIFEGKVDVPNTDGLPKHVVWRHQFLGCVSNVLHVNSKLVTKVENFLLMELPSDGSSGHPLWQGFHQDPGAFKSYLRIQESLDMLRDVQNQLRSMSARIDKFGPTKTSKVQQQSLAASIGRTIALLFHVLGG